MFEGKTVAAVVPCYNEETQIAGVLETMPDFVDLVLVVDDASRDGTAAVVERHIDGGASGEREVVLLRHERNRGVGAAICTGYAEARRRRIDLTAVMAGDGQMDPDQLDALVGPVARGRADYAKANRLFYQGAWGTIPRHRYLGNAFLSMMTKIASGYWHVADSQTGYTAISLGALDLLDLDAVYPRYGYPNDLLVRLNLFDLRVADVHLRPIYNVGEQSKMRAWRVIPRMTWLLFRLFLWRMKEKYVICDFHPLVLFYGAGILTGLMSVGFFVRLLYVWYRTSEIPDINALVWALCAISSTQFGLFAMWFDMEMNRHLNCNMPAAPPPRSDIGQGRASDGTATRPAATPASHAAEGKDA
jgi:glycosyltransferase involved in cell wall biosynthesis